MVQSDRQYHLIIFSVSIFLQKLWDNALNAQTTVCLSVTAVLSIADPFSLFLYGQPGRLSLLPTRLKGAAPQNLTKRCSAWGSPIQEAALPRQKPCRVAHGRGGGSAGNLFRSISAAVFLQHAGSGHAFYGAGVPQSAFGRGSANLRSTDPPLPSPRYRRCQKSCSRATGIKYATLGRQLLENLRA